MGTGGFDPDVPVAGLAMDEAGVPRVVGGWALQASLADVLEAALTDRFICAEGAIDTREAFLERIREFNKQVEASTLTMKAQKRRR